jgi:hypothetical protein
MRDSRVRTLAFTGALSIAVLSVLSAAAPSKAKVHGFALSGTVASVDEAGKTFVVASASGRKTTLAWTPATKVTGGVLKPGEKVTLRYLDKDRKHIATSIQVEAPRVAIAGQSSPRATPSPTPAGR